MSEHPNPGMADALEVAFAKVRTENEARAAAQLAADNVPTDNVAVLGERAARHTTDALDRYWGHFGDMQKELTERVIAPLLAVVSRVVAERDQTRGLVLSDFLFRLEQSAGDAAAEKLLADNPDLDAAAPGEKDTATAATSTPQPFTETHAEALAAAVASTISDYPDNWISSKRQVADLQYALADYHAAAEQEKNTPAGAAFTPQLDERTACLYDHILSTGGTWTTTSAHRWLTSHGGADTTRRRTRTALQHLAGLGYLIEHDRPGRISYTANYAKGDA